MEFATLPSLLCAALGALERAYIDEGAEADPCMPRNSADSVSYLPRSALLSQALVAFAMNYEERSPVPLSLAIAVIKHIPRDGRPVHGLGHSVGISALHRHGFVRVTGVAGGEVISLTPKGSAVSGAHEERVQAVETDWCRWFGSAQVNALRRALENVVDATSFAARDPMPKKRVLILCTGNSARSQMAEGLLRHDAGDLFDVESAGTKPSSLRPEAIAAMRELGIDIGMQRSKHVDEFEGRKFDYIITVCDSARESCPVFFGAAKRLHRNFEDPAALNGSEEERLALFRRVRDELRAFLREFANLFVA